MEELSVLNPGMLCMYPPWMWQIRKSICPLWKPLSRQYLGAGINRAWPNLLPTQEIPIKIRHESPFTPDSISAARLRNAVRTKVPSSTFALDGG